jgi:probable rRNA maturation factor
MQQRQALFKASSVRSDLKVYIVNRQKDLPLPIQQIKHMAKEVVALEKKNFDETTLHFVDIKTISKLHNLYFQDPSATDCISFPMDQAEQPGYKILGEVFVCPKVALEYTDKHGGSPYNEIALYIVHGLLHLMGYDDCSTSDKRKMRRAEKKHMKHLQEKQLIL